MDDLGVPPFMETPKLWYFHVFTEPKSWGILPSSLHDERLDTSKQM